MSDTKILETLKQHEKLLVDNQKMLLAVMNSQSAHKDELLSEIKKAKIELRGEMKEGFEKVNKRLDAQGKSLAYLEDDAPTVKEFHKLEGRVTKIEHKIASA